MARGGVVLEFHAASLFPAEWFDLVIVLRCNNTVLFDRLMRRGYGAAKVAENVEAEIMQVVEDEVREAFEPEQVVVLPSESLEQLEENAERCAQWMAAWRADQDEAPDALPDLSV
jgi:adenylate kinase